PPCRHRWVVVWFENMTPPQIFLFNCALLDDPRDDVKPPRPWLALLRDAPFFLIWHETHSRWHGVPRSESARLPEDSPIILLAHPGVQTLNGSGEAIAWLELWR
ncbi:hypothetical protein LXA43DRAFT_838531, partial [Ganoderma leucocontextum]